MPYRLIFTPEAQQNLAELQAGGSKAAILKAVRKALGFMQVNLRHPSLKTHKFSSLEGKNGEEVFECYAQNNTPGAWRIFWHYGPDADALTIIAITPHP